MSITTNDVIAANKTITAGLSKHYRRSSIVLHGETWSATELMAELAQEDRLIAQARNARTAWLQTTGKLSKKRVANRRLRLAIAKAILVNHGASSKVYKDFGFTVRKRRQPTTAVKAAAVRKRRKTRAARKGVKRKRRSVTRANGHAYGANGHANR